MYMWTVCDNQILLIIMMGTSPALVARDTLEMEAHVLVSLSIVPHVHGILSTCCLTDINDNSTCETTVACASTLGNFTGDGVTCTGES
jgi:hypothetical protein